MRVVRGLGIVMRAIWVVDVSWIKLAASILVAAAELYPVRVPFGGVRSRRGRAIGSVDTQSDCSPFGVHPFKLEPVLGSSV